MSRYFLLMAAAVVALLTPLGRARAGITFCNQTPTLITSAIGDLEGGVWVAHGWFNIAPGNCTIVWSREPSSRYFYSYATAFRGLWHWDEGGVPFCVMDDAFTLARPPCIAGARAETFQQFDIGAAQDFTRNFGCGACQMPVVSYDAASRSIAAYAVITAPVGDSTLHIPVEGHFALGRSASAVEVNMTLTADLQPLQEAIGDIISKAANRSENCGEHLTVYGISLRPVANSAEIALSARYQRTYCTYANVPQMTCHDTWITVGPLHTKGPPSCSVHMASTRTSSTSLQQSGSMRVDVTPQVAGGNQIGLAASVAAVHLDGLGQVLADLFRVNLRALAQQRLDAAVGGSQMQYSIPNELRPFARVESVTFYDGGDRLMMRADGRFSIALAQLAALCNQFSGWSGCAAQ